MKKVFFIEANIAAGKTTLLRECSKNGIAVYEEPIRVWKEEYVEKDGSNILGLFYDDMKKWSFQLEVTAFVTRIRELEKAMSSKDPVILVERSVLVDYHVFAPNLREQEKMTDLEWKIYEAWYKLAVEYILYPLLKKANVEFIYIETLPSTCWERKLERDRKEEKPMPLEYLEKISEKHRTWLLDFDFPYKVHRINGNLSASEVFKQVLEIVK